MAAPLGLETPQQRGIFVTYMGLWVSYGLLNELAKRRGVAFNSTAAVVLQSLLKLALASALFLRHDVSASSVPAKLRALMDQTRAHRSLLLLYLIPAGLYALYDVLSYVNLRQFDAPTYFLLLQFRLVVTGLLHQLVFARRLNRNQWLALLVTTAGCAIKTLGSTSSAASTSSTEGPSLVAYASLMVQMLASTFAGVYNELLLKKQAKIPVNLQNVFMYADSILCTGAMLALGLTGQTLSEVARLETLRTLLSPVVLSMVLIMSAVGLVTSLFLKHLDSVRKAIASALELVVLPILSVVLFGVPITVYTVAAVACVAFGVYIYSVPVESDPSKASKYEAVPSTDLKAMDESDKMEQGASHKG